MKNPLQNSPQLQAVLRNQEATSAAQAEIQKLHEAIAVQNTKAAQIAAHAAQVAALETQLEDLLADIATGQDKEAELEALGARLALQKKDAPEQGAQAAMSQTVAGLTRKLERTQSELKELQEKHPKLLCALVRAQAEAVGEAYVMAGQEVGNQFVRLMALGMLLRNFDGDQNIFMANRETLDLPAFRVSSVLPHAEKGARYCFLAGPEGGREIKADQAEEEKAVLRAMGVEIV